MFFPPLTCHRVKRAERDGLHGLSCTKCANRFASHVSSQFSLKADVGISRLAFKARTAWTKPNQGIQTQFQIVFIQKFKLKLTSIQNGGCKYVKFFWSKRQRFNLLIEFQGSNGMRSNFIVFVVWVGHFASFAK